MCSYLEPKKNKSVPNLMCHVTSLTLLQTVSHNTDTSHHIGKTKNWCGNRGHMGSHTNDIKCNITSSVESFHKNRHSSRQQPTARLIWPQQLQQTLLSFSTYLLGRLSVMRYSTDFLWVPISLWLNGLLSFWKCTQGLSTGEKPKLK